MLRVGIMGGTFNPIHYAHLILAEFAREQFSFDKVMFLPSKRPAYKDMSGLLEDKHRFNMTKLAICNNDAFYISDIELNREGNTYTIDTLDYLTKNYKDEEYYLIIGGDSLFNIEKWRDFDRLLKVSHIIASMRGEYDNDHVRHKITELNDKYKADIQFLSIPSIDISSSMIRDRLSKRQSLKYLMPDEVIQYIYDNRLYTM